MGPRLRGAMTTSEAARRWQRSTRCSVHREHNGGGTGEHQLPAFFLFFIQFVEPDRGVIQF